MSPMVSLLLIYLSFFIVPGSIPESKNGKLFNTCTIFNPAGEMIATHQKVICLKNSVDLNCNLKCLITGM